MLLVQRFPAAERFAAESPDEVDALERQRRLAVPLGGMIGASEFQAGGHEIDHVAHLVFEFTAAADARGPVGDKHPARSFLPIKVALYGGSNGIGNRFRPTIVHMESG